VAAATEGVDVSQNGPEPKALSAPIRTARRITEPEPELAMMQMDVFSTTRRILAQTLEDLDRHVKNLPYKARMSIDIEILDLIRQTIDALSPDAPSAQGKEGANA
jgi:hypothetical protein